jgi:protocatechuate 3,4-dioxygenase beta subunit
MNTISPRHVVRTLVASAASLALPSLAASRRALPAMTEGPFYPSAAYRSRGVDWDADLTIVAGRAPEGQPRPGAAGEHLDLHGPVIDVDGRVIDGAEVEIWQCDAFGSYRHPRGAGERVDDGFQGFGMTRTDREGIYRFRTIRPVPYSGRTPHIHVKLRHPSFGEFVSQLFVAGDPGNASDGLYRRLSSEDRLFADFTLRRAPAGSEVVWVAERSLVVGR